MTSITEVETAEQIEDIRFLFREYENSIGIDLCFQNFNEELKTLPGKYTPPKGGLFIASENGELLGCVALRPLEYPDIAELKRLYVRPAARGKHLGYELSRTALNRAVEAGYTFVRLDTLSTMNEAQRLYRKIGFTEIVPYTYNPISTAVYMELDLKTYRANFINMRYCPRK